MDTLMCQSATVRARIAGVLLFTALTAAAQTTPARLSWRRIGSAAIDLALASPATGPVSRVWFSADGSRLYALTPSGRERIKARTIRREPDPARSEEHTSELQSRLPLGCRLLLEKKKTTGAGGSAPGVRRNPERHQRRLSRPGGPRQIYSGTYCRRRPRTARPGNRRDCLVRGLHA